VQRRRSRGRITWREEIVRPMSLHHSLFSWGCCTPQKRSSPAAGGGDLYLCRDLYLCTRGCEQARRARRALRTRNTPECAALADRLPLASEDSAPRLWGGGAGTASPRRWLPRLAIVSGVLLSADGVLAAEAGGIVAANDARRVFAVLLMCGGCGMWYFPVPKASQTCLCHLQTWIPRNPTTLRWFHPYPTNTQTRAVSSFETALDCVMQVYF
jgi:hypothetical protein